MAADNVAIAGDSAGGGLTAATALALRDAGDDLPGAIVCISPWVDMEFTGESMTTRADADPMVSPGSIAPMAGMFLGEHGDPHDPLAAPLHADLAGLPPTLIHVGDAEVLLDDSTRLAAKAEAAGVDVTLEVWPEMVHVWHASAGYVPESDAAIGAIADFLRQRLGYGRSPPARIARCHLARVARSPGSHRSVTWLASLGHLARIARSPGSHRSVPRDRLSP
ncbi:MAG: alpha/beta hydrolase fold domain-containing protein [Acidimicrobiales bacterium]